LKAGDWQEVCQKAQTLQEASAERLHQFFEENFKLYQVVDDKKKDGLFTGYYSPLIKGSLEKDENFQVPIYARPNNLIKANLQEFSESLPNQSIVGRVDHKKRFRPYYNRAAINQGALKEQAKVLVWVSDLVDRTFLEIQGSGMIELADGKILHLGYSVQNGRKYRSIAKVLIDKGVMSYENASMQGIRAYLNTHPDQKEAVLNHNESFVFFKKQEKPGAIGSQGIALTDEVSLAVDRKYLPMGVPIWLETSKPVDENALKSEPFERLMVAQDTGGAIQGLIRGDVYWGASKRAESIAGRMKNRGRYFVLLPNTVKLS
jgi:membrane-bound lytic murein transglycosylase A